MGRRPTPVERIHGKPSACVCYLVMSKKKKIKLFSVVITIYSGMKSTPLLAPADAGFARTSSRTTSMEGFCRSRAM